MQSTGGFVMDPELLACRKKVQGIIYQSIMNGRFPNQNPNNDGWKPRAADITKKLEELVFKEAVSKEDYMSLTQSRIEQQIFHVMKTVRGNSQQSSHRIASSSNMNTMMPTPGMAHSGSGTHPVSADNTTMNNANVSSNLVQNINANISVGAANNSMFTANGTNNLHGYRQTPANVIHGTGGNSNTMQRSGLSHELSQMIPTPGLSSNNNNNNYNSNPMSSNSDMSSHGQSGGFSNIDTVMVPQQQKQQQYVSSQNSRMLQGFGSQRGAAIRSNMQQNIPTFGLSNVGSNGSSIGLTGSSSMPAANRLESQDIYSNNASYATFNRQQLQQNIQTPSSQHQLLPMAGHGYSGSNMYGSGSSFVSTVNNNQRMSSMNLHAKQKTNHVVPTHHNSNMQQQQQPSLIKPQFDSSQQHMNLQTSQTPQEYQMNPQNQMQNVQHQPFQQPLEPTNHERSLQKPQPQQQYSQNQPQLIPKTELLRQNSTTNFGGRSIQDHRHHQSVESFKESLVSQPPQQHHLSEPENPYQHISNNDDNIGTNLFNDDTQFPGSQDFQTSYSHGSQFLLPEQPLAIESQNEFSSLMNASQSEAFNQQNWQPQMRQQNDSTGDTNFLCDQQQQFHGVTNGHIEVQRQQQSVASSDVAHVSASQADTVPSHSARGNGNLESKRQKTWLLLLLHSYKCPGDCTYDGCLDIHKLWVHMDKCKPEQQCKMPKCVKSKALINHFIHCSLEACPLCIPVRKFAVIHRKPLVIKKIESGKPINMEITTTNRNDAPSVEPNSIDIPPPSPKRMKIQQSFPSLVPKRETSPIPPYMNLQSNAFLDSDIHIPQQSSLVPRFKPEPSVEVKINPLPGVHHTNFGDQIKKDSSTNAKNTQIRHAASAEPLLVADEHDGHIKQETFLVEKDKNKLVKVETKQEVNAASHPDPISGSKSGKPKVKGVSMTELFTPEQINDHIVSLRKWVGQSKAKVEKNQALERSMTENSCQLCAAEKLTFDPPPIYCTPCGARIKRNAMYYTIGSGDTRHYFCIPCYNEARGESIQVDGTAYPKARLEKKKNDEETEEWWVQCDKCEAWQHQICALFNGRRNDGGQAEYTCPNCYVLEVKNGERKPLPQSAVLGAKDLPRTILSDHIEQRLFRRLKQEKQERARHFGKSIDEISGADSLVVRVVSSVDKKLEVKQRFLEIFQEENYPAEFPYKSKVVLLFQNIEGVEVCLFGMYVQEFGSECQFPNQRRVYLSYLDSVKYFRPDIKTVTGEALRTFVYHEILIAYLEYCKKRGFTSCYIWACPPLKGEDYILYCHPEIQKTPKSDKLREWYLAMLRKAAKENIVVELTNLYDHFFTSTGECKAKVTAARLPYFDGDYWPGAAEDMINQLRLEEDGRKLQKKGKTKKLITKRALKAAGQIDISGNASKDALLMQKLGETIYPMKEDFIMVHLQHSCTHCCLLMVSGTRWVCNKCKNFQLCEKCYDTEQRLEARERHPINSRDKHDLCPVEITDVTLDTKDKDEILESEFFDTRQAFLSLCQGNHYQYDTLRRAKHSSMMMLYHLHNPTAPAFVTTCNVCLRDVEAGQGWRCEECPEFDVCNACYKKDGGIDHPHPLTNYPTTSERDAQNQEARQQRVVQLRKMLELLVHASQCRYPSCQYPNCRKVKGLFRHGINCKVRASGGCLLCKKMWYLLQLHARACKESECHVPRCKDLKDHLRRLQQQSDSRRRAAVMEMMRQRHAEVAGGND